MGTHGRGRGVPHRKVKAQSNSHLPIIRHELASSLFGPLSHESLLVLEILPGVAWHGAGTDGGEGSNSFAAKSSGSPSVVAVLPLGVLLGKITIYLSLSDRHRLENGFSLGPQTRARDRPIELCVAAITLRRRKRRRRTNERTNSSV